MKSPEQQPGGLEGDYIVERRRHGDRRGREDKEEPEDFEVFMAMVFDNIRDYMEKAEKGEIERKAGFDAILNLGLEGLKTGLNKGDMKVYKGLLDTGDLTEEEFAGYQGRILEKGSPYQKAFLSWLTELWFTEVKKREEEKRKKGTQ